MYDYLDVLDYFGGRIIGDPLLAGLIALGIFLAFLILVGIYVYFSLAWQRIAQKMRYKKPWLAWIPFANISMWLQMGKFHWAWIFLILIPIAGWIALYILFIIASWRVLEKLKYPGWLSLSLLFSFFGGIWNIVYAFVIGIVAWEKK